MAVAHGAALAMRMIQINLEQGGGQIDSARGFFTPFTTLPKFAVRTLPNITFYYEQQGDEIRGLYDFYLFGLNPSVPEKGLGKDNPISFAELYDIIDILRHPLVIPIPIARLKWPGDGKGPYYTPCLFAPCDFGTSLFVPRLSS